MGCADIFCIICGLPYSNWYMKEQGLNKESKWLNDCTILTLDDKVISKCQNKDCYAQFIKIGTNITFEVYGYYQSNNISENNSLLFLGSFIHTDCWKFIEKEYEIKLIYSMIPFMLSFLNKKKNKTSYSHPVFLTHINYGQVEKYWKQYFDFEKLIQDGNQYLFNSPLVDKKNAKRIKRIISQMKLKKEDRIGPQISATWYPDNTYRIGNDNMIWYTKNKKWNQMKIDLNMIKILVSYKEKDSNNKDVKKLFAILNKIRQLGQDSTEPIFLNNLLQQYNRDKKLNYITTEIISSFELCSKVLEQIKKLKTIKIY